MSREKETQEMRNTEERMKNLRQDMDKRLSELKVQMNDVQRKATKTLAERPMLALGVAFIAGMAVGIALSKSSD